VIGDSGSYSTPTPVVLGTWVQNHMETINESDDPMSSDVVPNITDDYSFPMDSGGTTAAERMGSLPMNNHPMGTRNSNPVPLYSSGAQWVYISYNVYTFHWRWCSIITASGGACTALLSNVGDRMPCAICYPDLYDISPTAQTGDRDPDSPREDPGSPGPDNDRSPANQEQNPQEDGDGFTFSAANSNAAEDAPHDNLQGIWFQCSDHLAN
jgi:hypothetical protein